MRFKEGVRVVGIQPELGLALQVANQVYQEHGAEMVITSLIEGRHSETSLHYAGAAADLRTRNLGAETQNKVRNEIDRRLTQDFDVILEDDHIHLEYQPRRLA